jgi:hypothetical protein
VATDETKVTQTPEKPSWAGKSPGYRFGGAGPGRPKGRKNNAMLAVEEFAREVVHSAEYRDSVYRRLKADTLHPSVECQLHHYAAGGKPTERHELKDTTNDIEMSPSELQARMSAVAKSLLAMQLPQDEESTTH